MSAGLSETATLTYNTGRSREAKNSSRQSATVRPQRSRRLQKRSSSNALTVSSSSTTTTGPMVPITVQHPDQSLAASPPSRNQQVIPQRSSSLRKQQRPPTADGATTRARSKPSAEQLGVRPPSSGAQDPDQQDTAAVAHDQKSPSPPLPPSTSSITRDQSGLHPPRTPRHVPLAPFDPSPLNPLYHIPSPEMSSGPFQQQPTSPASSSSPPPPPPPPSTTTPPAQPTTTNSDAPKSQKTGPHLDEHTIPTLPPGFRPGTSSHQTDVETVWRPAVTREHVKEHTVEVVQERVTREIHVHHYYTHVQPVRAVEVLPARHFIVDPATGQKVEIPAPEGWEMPADMRPRRPEAEDLLEPVTRHYLVDEDHPQGVAEPPPRDFPTRSQSELNRIARASHTARWSPFPKVD
ncbi:hypothetical protein LTS17_003903 [Exophiala oligosperma]